MKNITLAVEDALLDGIRRYAVDHGTTVNGIIRDHFKRIVLEQDKAARARLRLIELSRNSTAEVGPITWKRDELYER